MNPGSRCQEVKTSFLGRLKEGRNILTLKYRQPLEVSSDTRTNNQGSRSAELGFAYLLYPLSPWQFAERFQMKLSVRWALPKRSLFGRIFLSDQRSLVCGELTREKEIPQLRELPEEGKTGFVWEKGRKYMERVYSFQEDFPRIFGCRANSIELEEDFHNNLERFLTQASAAREELRPERVSSLGQNQ